MKRAGQLRRTWCKDRCMRSGVIDMAWRHFQCISAIPIPSLRASQRNLASPNLPHEQESKVEYQIDYIPTLNTHIYSHSAVRACMRYRHTSGPFIQSQETQSSIHHPSIIRRHISRYMYPSNYSTSPAPHNNEPWALVLRYACCRAK